MAEVTKQARKRGKAASDKAASQVNGGSRDAIPADSEEDKDTNGSESSGVGTITSELKDTVREAAIEVLKPVMRQATTSAAKYAVKNGPGMIKDKVAPKIADAGGAGALAKNFASKGGGVAGAVGGIASSIGDKLPGGGKKEGESPSGTGRGRRLPVEEIIDIGADLETVYDQFTQFEDWPEFMHRVERIEQRDDATLMWHENIWGVRRSWEVEITDQSPCHRIAWRSTSGPKTIGVVTFHRLSDHLTRVAITMDFQPKGLFEKTSSGTRISRRALRSDLMRFKAFIELRDEATGSWRGRIEDGEVQDDQESRDDELDETEARGSEEEDEQYEDEEADEPVASEDEEYEEEEEDEEPRASEEEDEEFEEDEEPVASEEEDEEPVASEEEDEEEEEPRASEEDEEEEEPRASEEEEEEEEEPRASEEEDEEEEEPEEAPRPRRRRRAATPAARSRSRSRS